MAIQDSLNRYLDRSFPLLLSHKQGVPYLAGMMVTGAVLLNLLQPFGTCNWHEPHKWMILSGYAGIYAGAYFLIQTAVWKGKGDVSTPAEWTLRHEFRVVGLLIPVSIVLNWLYSIATITELQSSWHSFLAIGYYTCITAVLFIVPFGYFIQSRLHGESHHIRSMQAQEPVIYAAAGTSIRIEGHTVVPDDIYYIESNHNNIHIRLLKDERQAELIVRYSLQKVTALLHAYPHLFRCHNSYIVNARKAMHWESDGNKLMLHLKDCKKPLPVSDKYKQPTKDILAAHAVYKKH